MESQSVSHHHTNRHLLARWTLALTGLIMMLMCTSLPQSARCNSLSATLSSLANQQQQQQQQQQQHRVQPIYSLPQASGHYLDEQQLIKKFMPELFATAQTDRGSIERALMNMLLAQRLYMNQDPTASVTQQIQSLGQLLEDSRTLPLTVGGNFQSIEPNQISGFDPGKRSYWKQCAVNAVSCFGRRKRR